MSNPSAFRSRPTGALALAGAALASLSLMAGAASAGESGLYYVGKNAATGATITSSTGSVTKIDSRLLAVAGDGTVQAFTSEVTPDHEATVLVDESGQGRIVDLGAGSVFAGNGGVVVGGVTGLRLVSLETGEQTKLAGVPKPASGTTRTVTAISAVADGALVATADTTPATSTGVIKSAAVWKLTVEKAEQIAEIEDGRVIAVAASPRGVDAVVADSDDRLSRTHIGLPGSLGWTEPMNLTLPAGVVSAALGFAEHGDSYDPLLTLRSKSSNAVYDVDGSVVVSEDGSKLFVSALDIQDPTSITNPLKKVAAVRGVDDGEKVEYRTAVTPRAVAATRGVIESVPARAALEMLVGDKSVDVDSGDKVVLKANTCFVATSAGTFFTRPATPAVECVKVAHKLVESSRDARRNVTVVETTADVLELQVVRRGGWKTVKTIEVNDGRARVRVPRGTVRVVAVADRDNVTNSLRLSR